MQPNSKYDVLTFPNVLLFIGLIGLLATTKWYTSQTYQGDKLIDITCTLVDQPELSSSGKEEVRYAFHVKEFFSEFWLIGTAIDEYKISISNNHLLAPGDTIKLSIEETSIPLLNNPLNYIYVWSLSHNNILLVDASVIREKNKKDCLFLVSNNWANYNNWTYILDYEKAKT